VFFTLASVFANVPSSPSVARAPFWNVAVLMNICHFLLLRSIWPPCQKERDITGLLARYLHGRWEG